VQNRASSEARPHQTTHARARPRPPLSATVPLPPAAAEKSKKNQRKPPRLGAYSLAGSVGLVRSVDSKPPLSSSSPLPSKLHTGLPPLACHCQPPRAILVARSLSHSVGRLHPLPRGSPLRVSAPRRDLSRSLCPGGRGGPTSPSRGGGRRLVTGPRALRPRSADSESRPHIRGQRSRAAAAADGDGGPLLNRTARRGGGDLPGEFGRVLPCPRFR
jgi:hypothetical protein